MPYKNKFPVATLISLVLIILTVHNPAIAENIASVLFPVVWPLFFIAGLAAIGVFIYNSTQLKKVQQEANPSEPYMHHSRRLQQRNELM